ncbi:MAG: pseudouridine synthase [Eubacteriales bacterium]|nr:pseudouridine synthase [Eubacteriales bacterium]
MAAQRIDKLLAAAGCCSRREAAALAKQGAVAVDGAVCRDVSRRIDPERCRLTFRGQRVGYQEHVYLMLHKPLGVLSATEDREQKTVLDLLPRQYRTRGIFPVGRLDKETSGLLLLTDDGALGHALTSPRRRVDKVYHAVTDGVLTQEAVAAFAAGLELRDGTRCRPAVLNIRQIMDGTSDVLVTVQEGKYHQVRRMLAACHAPVLSLERLSEGAVRLDPALEPGQWRELTPQELEALRADAGEAGNG